MHITARLALCLVVVCAASAAFAQPDIRGDWTIQATVSSLPNLDVQVSCQYQGTATVTQAGSDVSGPISLTQTTSDPQCPPTLSGNLTGMVDTSNNLTGTIVTGSESATITGTVTDTAGALSSPAARPPFTITGGGFNVTAGPFLNASGSFGGQQTQQAPSAGPLALALLVVLLLAGGTFYLTRRRAA